MKNLLNVIQRSDAYKDNTLVISAEDESGGFYDHVAPPDTSPTDNIEYGARIANLFLGNLVKKNYTSHA